MINKNLYLKRNEMIKLFSFGLNTSIPKNFCLINANVCVQLCNKIFPLSHQFRIELCLAEHVIGEEQQRMFNERVMVLVHRIIHLGF